MPITSRLTALILLAVAIGALSGQAMAQMRTADKPRELLTQDPRQVQAEPQDIAPDDDPYKDVLSANRWWSEDVGLSMRPPLKSRMIELDGDDAKVRIVGEAGYIVRLFIKRSKSPASAMTARDLTLRSLERANIIQKVLHKSSPDDEKPSSVSGRPASALYYRTVPDKSGRAKMVGQVYFNVDERTIAMLQFDVPDMQYRDTAHIFAAILAEIVVTDPKELALQREAELERGDAWLKSLTPEDIENALLPEQYFIMLDNKTPTGYVVILQKMVTGEPTRGASIRVMALLDTDTQEIRSKSHFFVSENLKDEYWSTEVSIRSTARTRGNIGNATRNLPDTIWREAGERAEVDGKMLIRVKRDTPAGAQVVDGPMPPKGYISQAETYLLDRLLPHDVAATYGFIAYSGNTGRMSMRTEEVKPTDNGTMVITTTAQGQTPQITVFDKFGSLVQRTLPTGHVLRPSSAGELKKTWPERFTLPEDE